MGDAAARLAKKEREKKKKGGGVKRGEMLKSNFRSTAGLRYGIAKSASVRV